MIRKAACLILALVVICSAALADDAVIERAIKLIGAEESGNNYGCAITDTNGKSSLGFMQWNGSRAAALMKSVIDADESSASDILGSSLLEKLKNATNCSLSSSELKFASQLLKTDAGISVQDEKAKSDVAAYVRKAKSLGIVDRTALCYYCDIVHQVGTGAIVKYHVLASELAGSYAAIRLEHLYKAALNFATHTKARRTRVYNKLLANPVDGEAAPKPKPSLTIEGENNVELPRFERIALAAKLENSNAMVYWKSSSKAIAKVTQKGVVRGIKRGTVKITAYTKSGLSASVTVKVVKRLK